MKSLVAIILILALVACTKEPQTAEQPPAIPSQETEAPAPAAATTAPAAQASAEQTIDVAGEFSPASITIPANAPVRLHFRRSDKPTCADEIVLPELNQRKKIGANETVTFELPPQQARTLTFACGMGMMKGTVVVQ